MPSISTARWSIRVATSPRRVNLLLVECGADPLPEEAVGRMVGDGAATLVARAFAASGRERPGDALDRFLAIYDARLLDHTRPYPGIPAVLGGLGAHAALAVLTNKPLEATRRLLAGLDLAAYFPAERVIGGDGPFARKPDPAGLRHLIAAAGTSAGATALVGDSVIDWRTARQASTAVCLARYGFGFEGFPVDQLGSDEWVVDRPEELLAILLVQRGRTIHDRSRSTSSFEAARAPIVIARAFLPRSRTESAAASRRSTSTGWPGLRSLFSMKRRNAGS